MPSQFIWTRLRTSDLLQNGQPWLPLLTDHLSRVNKKSKFIVANYQLLFRVSFMYLYSHCFRVSNDSCSFCFFVDSIARQRRDRNCRNRRNYDHYSCEYWEYWIQCYGRRETLQLNCDYRLIMSRITPTSKIQIITQVDTTDTRILFERANALDVISILCVVQLNATCQITRRLFTRCQVLRNVILINMQSAKSCEFHCCDKLLQRTSVATAEYWKGFIQI